MNNTKYISNYIIDYYNKHKRNLPWRNKKKLCQNPYHTLVSEIMLQQTKVDKVIVFYRKFLNKWPTIKKLSEADVSDVLAIWSGLGYYRRAINLHRTAQIIDKKFNGIIPKNKESLKMLPGIGEYTASAIISFAYGKYSIIIDTNIKRFIMRVLGLKEDIKERDLVTQAKTIFPRENTSDFAQGIMDYASKICLKIKPKCNLCEIKKYCNYTYSVDRRKSKIVKEKSRKYCYSYFLVTNKEKFLITKRPYNGMLAGLYEVPTSVWNIGDWPENCYKNIKLCISEKEKIFVDTLKHEFSHFILFTRVSLVKVKEGNFKKNNYIWVDKERLKKLPISSLTNKIVNYSFSRISCLK